MKHLLNLILALSVAIGASANDVESDPDSTGFKFTDIKTVKTTSVKDQNRSGTCWCFSGNSFFEDEIMRKGGKELDLSEMFVVRYCYWDKAIKYIRMYGATNFSEGGSILDIPYVWERYGAIPEEAYNGLNYGEPKHNHSELSAALKAYLDVIVSKPNKKISTAWMAGFEGILDAYLGKIPETFEYNGKTYTPRSYADGLGLKMN
ncbi:MAG: aminopeptidase, partial [Muribaculaceae bacterium]|nr:aminopeptidase [Muribaculaceae bacterium]